MTRRHAGAIALVLALGLMLAMAAMGVLEARWRPIVRHYAVIAPGMACAGSPMRIALLADLHLHGGDTPRLSAIVEQTNALHPDLVLLAGDFFKGDGRTDQAQARALLAPLAGLRPREATLAVLGNNDWHDGARMVARALAAAHVARLGNDAWTGRHVAVLGIEEVISGTANPVLARERLDERLARDGRTAPPMLLWMAHNPIEFDRVPGGRGLMVAGHTHGGQVLPGITVPFMRWLDRHSRTLAPKFGWSSGRYVRGAYGQGAWRMIVTSGIGTSGLPIRLGVPPEIVAIDLTGCAPRR